MCRFSVDFKGGGKKIVADRFHSTTVYTAYLQVHSPDLFPGVNVHFCHSGMVSGGMCTCLMSSGHTLSIGQHGLPLGGGRSESLDRSTAPRCCQHVVGLPPWALWHFPLCCIVVACSQETDLIL